MAVKSPQITASNLKSKEKTKTVMDMYATSSANTSESKEIIVEEKPVAKEVIIVEPETSPEIKGSTEEPQPKENKGAKRGRKPSEKGKYNLHVTIDTDINEFLDEMVEESRDNKSVIVNRILFRAMKEYRANHQ